MSSVELTRSRVKTKTLSVGDSAPLFALSDQQDRLVVLGSQVGTPVVLFFFDSNADTEKIALMQVFREAYSSLQTVKVKVFGISQASTNDLNAVVQAHELPFSLLSDTGLKVMQGYGVDPDSTGIIPTTVFLLDRNLQIWGIYQPFENALHMKHLLQSLKAWFPPEEPRVILSQAPVLLIPNVLDPDFCQELIRVWETQGNEDSGFMVEEEGKTLGKLDPTVKIRRDHFVEDPALQERIDLLLRRRIVPEVRKCFNYEVTRREQYKIACYEAHKGGYFRAHRDNTTGGTAHRRWAVTLNLNAEAYEGGCLQFPEYGPHSYKPATGSAVIFSCSLMHEATDVTAGTRFVLLTFLYGEIESQRREEYRRQHGNSASEEAY